MAYKAITWIISYIPLPLLLHPRHFIQKGAIIKVVLARTGKILEKGFLQDQLLHQTHTKTRRLF